MLTHKTIKTICVNLGVNYCQFEDYIFWGLEECAWRIGNPPKKIENDRLKWLRLLLYVRCTSQ